MRGEIRFLLDGAPRNLTQVDPTMTVLDYLRLEEHLVGTKEGCNEGDCGACTVVLARPRDGALHYEAVNACIQFVGTLDGCQLITVEHLAKDGALHPVQQAMVDCHGSQCGFCTPGFVMSLFAMTRDHAEAPDDQSIDDVLAGNLCRCTGYAPIVKAARQAYQKNPRGDVFARDEAATFAKLGALQDDATIAVSDAAGARRFFAPAGLDDLAALYLQHPDATLVAGSTDVGLWVTKDMQRPETVIYLGRVAELAQIAETKDSIEIGAGVSYSAAMAVLGEHYPDMGEVVRRIGSVQIRNAGTIGGNVANGSPIGDSPPLLIAAGAILHLRKGGERRSLPIEDFFIDYGRQDRAPGELVERISLPLPEAGTRFRAYKISKRFDQDISAVLGAFSLKIEAGQVSSARLAFGGLAATPKRAAAAEAALAGAAWNEATVARAMAALAEDFSPISDWRASADYRLKVSQNLLRRCFIETTEPDCETRLVGQPGLAHA
ncbi:xanthine dehydrogenase small subunit [Pelagibius litoralis]|uniref:Xanthine dehydrogenase small subunit n=1 Tax=Pelagibius litoralis TaxID=374515 RepID=A0A967EVH9_9PROT|nr:xanthine dehydrogenase small subunit [Pelagibius litoralis]NIA68691.1 xanthine dehydrogenase small subunit [Pelagibius litoralis]